MSQPTNTFDSYDAVGAREDLSNVIYDISPDETPFYSKCRKVKATNVLHEWQTDALRAAGDNKHVEGDETTATARAATTRLGNRSQIFKDAVAIPDTDDTTDKAGRGKEIMYQSLKAAKEQKLDIERALFLNNAAVAGNSTTARELAGVPTWIVTNVDFQSGNSGANATGDGTDARTDDGTPTAFSQTKFDNVMQQIWEEGGKANTCYLSAFQMNAALGFEGMNNQRSTVQATQSGKNAVINAVDIYMTSFGAIEFRMSRLNRSRDVFLMQDDMWNVAVKRPTSKTNLAKTGDNSKVQIITELTLCALNEKSSGAVFDNTTS